MNHAAKTKPPQSYKLTTKVVGNHASYKNEAEKTENNTKKIIPENINYSTIEAEAMAIKNLVERYLDCNDSKTFTKMPLSNQKKFLVEYLVILQKNDHASANELLIYGKHSESAECGLVTQFIETAKNINNAEKIFECMLANVVDQVGDYLDSLFEDVDNENYYDKILDLKDSSHTHDL